MWISVARGKSTCYSESFFYTTSWWDLMNPSVGWLHLEAGSVPQLVNQTMGCPREWEHWGRGAIKFTIWPCQNIQRDMSVRSISWNFQRKNPHHPSKVHWDFFAFVLHQGARTMSFRKLNRAPLLTTIFLFWDKSKALFIASKELIDWFSVHCNKDKLTQRQKTLRTGTCAGPQCRGEAGCRRTRTLTWGNRNNEKSKATSIQLCWSCTVSARVPCPFSAICSCTNTCTLPGQLSLAIPLLQSCYLISPASLHYLPSAVSLVFHNTQFRSPTNLLHQPSNG